MPESHYIPKCITDVSSKDSRVSITGKVVGTGNGFLILDDGTGKIEVASDFQVEKNKIIRAFCSVSDEKLKADIVQNMDGFDLNLFKKINELYIKAGV